MPEVQIKIPGDSETSTEVVIVKWLVNELDEVEEGQPVLEAETDKANIEVPSPVSGFIRSIMVNEGDVVKTGHLLAIIETETSLKPAMIAANKKGLLSVMLRLGVICEHCNNTIPVNGFVEDAKCTKCQEITPLSGKLRWQEILNYQNPGIDIFKATQKHKPGEGDYGAWQPVKLKTWRKWPLCTSCNREFEQSDIEKAIENNGQISCSQCSATEQMKPSPDFIKKAFPQVLYSMDKLPGNMMNSGSKINSSKPVVMACMSCAGSLRVDGKGRMVDCEFCGSSNYLPDELWLAMHPQPKMEDWFIIFEMSK